MKVVLIVFWLVFQLSAREVNSSEEELEKLPLIALLLKNGHHDRASQVFQSLTEKEKQTDPKRVATLEGLISLAQEDFKAAKEHFLRARNLGVNEPDLSIYLAQAFFGLQDYKAVIAEFSKDPSKEALLIERPRLGLLVFESYWNQEELVSAFNFLDRLMQTHPELNFLKLRYVKARIDLGLIQTTMDWVLDHRRVRRWSERDFLTLSSIFNGGKEILEMALLLFPQSRDVRFQLASVYTQEQKFLAAASVLEPLGQLFALELSELYRQSGHVVRADYLASLIQKPEERTRQRLTLYLSQGEFDRATILEKDLQAFDLLQSDQLRYALAYAFYKTRNFAQAENHLKKIQAPQVYEKALALRSSMIHCQENIWACD